MEVHNYNDAVRIFDKCIIRYGDEPVFVNKVTEALELDCFKIHDHRPLRFKVNDANINITPIPTGYVNGYGTTIYLSRGTPRVYHQGLSRDNLRVELFGGGDNDMRLRAEVTQLTSIHVAEMVHDIYPTLPQALAAIEEGAKSVAWSRTKAIDHDHNVYYKTRNIGVYDQKRNVIILNANNKHFRWGFEEKCE